VSAKIAAVISGRSSPWRFWREPSVPNELLRQVDWRFLLPQREAPRTLDLTDGSLAEALRLVGPTVDSSGAEADLAVMGLPTRQLLETALRTLRPGGAVVCLWKAPRPGRVRRARARLKQAGLVDISFYRTGPQPGETEIWLPLDAAEIVERVLAERPPRSPREALERRAWRALAPVCAIARLPGETADPLTSHFVSVCGTKHELTGDDGLPDPDAWVLLTGGAESDAKVVGLPFSSAENKPGVVAKFARVAKSDAALEREATVLRELERERPNLAGVPRLRASGRRAGQVAIVQDAIDGKALNATMNPAEFAAVAPEVTRWLIALAGEPAPQPPSVWARRLVEEPLEELERDFAELAPADFARRARRALADLESLPLVCEHRDFGPWNIVIADGGPAAIDWEDAEPHGLPGLDLIYFLTSCAFAIEVAGGDVNSAQETNRRLLDPETELGKVATVCLAEYRTALGIGEGDFRRLHLLCWVVQTLIACRRLVGATQGEVPAAADANLFLRLAEDELRRLEDRS
jgi:Phosphotransferase enzyme family